MKNLRKKIHQGVVLAALICGLMGNSLVTHAANHIGTCGATAVRIYCGAYLQSVSAGSHLLYTTSNGINVNCAKTNIMHFHTINCAGCGAIQQSNVVRTCIVDHQICPDETSVCQR